MWTSFLTRPKEDTVSLVKVSIRGTKVMIKGFDTPDSHKRNPHILPTEPLPEFHCFPPWLGIRGIDGKVVTICPLQYTRGVWGSCKITTEIRTNQSDAPVSPNQPVINASVAIDAINGRCTHLVDHASKCPYLICASREACKYNIICQRQRQIWTHQTSIFGLPSYRSSLTNCMYPSSFCLHSCSDRFD